MRTRDVEIGMDIRSIPLKRFFFFVALAKAGVAGASVGLALLGATDLTFMVTASQWWDSIRPDSLINKFAIVGGVFGMGWKVVRLFWV